MTWSSAIKSLGPASSEELRSIRGHTFQAIVSALIHPRV
jgi:hypothetical protein